MRWLFAGIVLLTAVLFELGSACAETPGEISSIVSPDATKLRVFGSISADDQQFGAVVAIVYQKPNGKTYICSGTLVARGIVLTAGHCGCGIASSYWVHIREDARGRPHDDDFSGAKGSPILFDQRVCRDGVLAYGNDLALIKLMKEIDLEGSAASKFHLSSLAFDLRPVVQKGDHLLAVGYGYTESHLIGMRRRANISIYSFTCEEWGLADVCSPFTEMILAEKPGPRVRADTCGGDSGGPVFRVDTEARMQLVAVTSRAAPGTQDDVSLGCGGGGIYTLIGRTSVKQWLQFNGVNIHGDLP